MKNKKLSGSFYTPIKIAEFLVNYIYEKFGQNPPDSILEPSAGDGVFVKTLYANPIYNSFSKVVAVERKKGELNKIIKKINHNTFKPINSDFLEYQIGNKEKFSLIIGNPPYIKKTLLKKKQQDLCGKIHDSAGLSKNKPKNIWTAFLIRCIQFTETNGILAFVLPAEFLQVKFAKELRDLVSKEFERVEIFTFDKLLFPDCKGQDTVLLICQRTDDNKGVFYCKIEAQEQLMERNFTLRQNISIKDSKWIHHHLSADDVSLMERLKNDLKTIGDYCKSKPGIVTAANDFFIVNESTVNEYSLQDFVKPIIQKGIYVNGSVVFNNRDFNKIVRKSKPAYLIQIDEDSNIPDYHPIHEYLQIGVALELDKRYKMKIRNHWASIPNIVTPAHGLFFKRCNEYPKLLKNYAGVFATDSAYVIEMNKGKNIESLIFSFYNSLTLAYAEYYGRFYGGGVLELIPSEFKKIPVPYIDITNRKFTAYTGQFENKASIIEICTANDNEILTLSHPGIDRDTIKKVSNIFERLRSHRLKL